MIDRDAIKALVAEQLALIELPERRSALEALLIEPRIEERPWDYGAASDRFPYWVVAESKERGTMLVWADQGFGPEFPWGFLFTDEPGFTSLGMDSQWCWYLEEAFSESGLWSGPAAEGDRQWGVPPRTRFSAR